MAWTGTLPARVLLKMEGGDARAVLQGVVTNDVDRLGPASAVYAALLTPQGKYLFDFFLIDDGDAVLIDVAADRAEALGRRLSMYCLRRDARVTGADPRGLALVWGLAEPPEIEGALVLRDPRDPALGFRIVSEAPARVLEELGAATDEGPALTALRVAHGVPETGIELTEDSFILEAGFERLHGVDFRKGCYVGQEVTARMKHKAELKKRLVQVAVAGEAPAGTPVVTGEGKPAGTLFSQSGGAGLAHLRLDRAGAPMTAGAAVVTLPGD